MQIRIEIVEDERTPAFYEEIDLRTCIFGISYKGGVLKFIKRDTNGNCESISIPEDGSERAITNLLTILDGFSKYRVSNHMTVELYHHRTCSLVSGAYAIIATDHYEGLPFMTIGSTEEFGGKLLKNDKIKIDFHPCGYRNVVSWIRDQLMKINEMIKESDYSR